MRISYVYPYVLDILQIIFIFFQATNEKQDLENSIELLQKVTELLILG